MERQNTRSVKKRALQRGEQVKGALKKAKAVIESLEGEEFELPQNIEKNSITMAEGNNTIGELGRLLMENMNTQMAAQREFQRERDEVNGERFRELVEGQNRHHRRDAEILANEFEKIRIEKEEARGRQNQKLPNYDGVNLEIDEWVDRVDAVTKCNNWELKKLLETLPTFLTGQAKRAFDSLTNDDKRTKESLFQNMRVKIDPQSERKNKEMFMMARRGASESMTSYIDRCRMYIRRSGGNPTEEFAKEMLHFKVYDSLTPTDRKILNATLGPNEQLETIITKADSMLATHVAVIGGVTGREAQAQQQGQSWGETNAFQNNNLVRGQNPRANNPDIICFRCGNKGHIRRYCTTRLMEQSGPMSNGNQINNSYRGTGGFMQTRPMNPNFNHGSTQWRPPFTGGGGIRPQMQTARVPMTMLNQNMGYNVPRQNEGITRERQNDGQRGETSRVNNENQAPLNCPTPL